MLSRHVLRERERKYSRDYDPWTGTCAFGTRFFKSNAHRTDARLRNHFVIIYGLKVYLWTQIYTVYSALKVQKIFKGIQNQAVFKIKKVK